MKGIVPIRGFLLVAGATKAAQELKINNRFSLTCF
jgi:hypothetical protein